MKRSIVSLVLAISLALVLTACGGNNGAVINSGKEEKPVESTFESSDKEEEARTEDTAEKSDESAPETVEADAVESVAEKNPEQEEFESLASTTEWDFPAEVDVKEYIDGTDEGNYYSICRDKSGKEFACVGIFNPDTVKKVYEYNGIKYPVLGISAINSNGTYLVPDGFMVLYNCQDPSMTKIEIPDSVITLGDLSLAYCHALEEIVIPDSVTKIGQKAFDYTENLTSITYKGTTYDSPEAFFKGFEATEGNTVE
ncbi:MAG: leucine-rich repeat domain-containing protein [Lachnospiraceae bacterium]|nr:leucine-rich repeat domain-containing protein [Lachnospiraceae bacterium]